jgi:hypothetical protein
LNAAPGEITQLLSEIGEARPGAEARLFTLIYPQMRRLAASYMRQERPGHTLQATALVNEAYLKLEIHPDMIITRCFHSSIWTQVFPSK